MSYTAEELLKMASGYDNVATKALVVTAKKKEKKSLDPKAKVRNRGTVCIPAESAKDKKDHFPINDEGQARNALARVHQYSSVPEWYSGSLKGLQALVARKVKAKYPKIDVGGKKKEKKSSIDYLLNKYAQEPSYGDMSEYELAQAAQQAAQQDHPGIGKVPADVWLKSLSDQGKIPGRLYQAALSVLKSMPSPSGAQEPPTIELDDVKPTPAPTQSGIPYREDVHKAQQKLNSLIMSGALNAHPLDPDGKLGKLTKEVMRIYKTDYLKVPSMPDEDVIRALSSNG